MQVGNHKQDAYIIFIVQYITLSVSCYYHLISLPAVVGRHCARAHKRTTPTGAINKIYNCHLCRANSAEVVSTGWRHILRRLIYNTNTRLKLQMYINTGLFNVCKRETYENSVEMLLSYILYVIVQLAYSFLRKNTPSLQNSNCKTVKISIENIKRCLF